MTPLVWLIPLLMMMAVLAMFVGVYRMTVNDPRIESRLEAISVPQTRRVARPSYQQHISGFFNKLAARWGITERIATRLARANVKLTVMEYVLIHLGIIIGGFIIGLLITRQAIPGIALAITAAFLPRFYLDRREHQRLKAFQEQLPDTLNLLVSSLQAGYGLTHAMEMVVQEMPHPTSEEFNKVVREMALGFSLPEALDHLVQRMNSDDLELIVTAISVQHEVGGNLAEILDTISSTIRDRVRLKGEIAVMTSQQRITGMVLSGMPFILGTLIMLINPDYMMTIFQPRWLFIPGLAIFMMIIGNLMIRRILSQEF